MFGSSARYGHHRRVAGGRRHEHSRVLGAEERVPTILKPLRSKVQRLPYGARLRDDPSLLAHLLDELTSQLPFDLLIVIEQAEDLVLQASKARRRRRQQALAMLSEVLRSAARCKIIMSTRTEFVGRLMNQLPEDSVRWRDYFLGELNEEQMLAAIILPTLNEPVPYSNEIPRQKYGFTFEEDLPQRLVTDALKAARDKQRSPLPLLQVLCADLYQRTAQARRQPDHQSRSQERRCRRRCGRELP